MSNLLVCNGALTANSQGFIACSSGFSTIQVDTSSLLSPITINALFSMPTQAELTTAMWIPFSTLMIAHFASWSYDKVISFFNSKGT